jgi:hypothetical protein
MGKPSTLLTRKNVWITTLIILTNKEHFLIFVQTVHREYNFILICILSHCDNLSFSVFNNHNSLNSKFSSVLGEDKYITSFKYAKHKIEIK